MNDANVYAVKSLTKRSILLLAIVPVWVAVKLWPYASFIRLWAVM